MRLAVAMLAGLLVSPAIHAEPWRFDIALDVTSVKGSQTKKIFHHLDSSGRRNIAATARGVAVIWEDDRDDTPRVYLAFKAHNEESFAAEQQISGEGEAYEPTLIALRDNRVVAAWEEDGHVIARVVDFGDGARLGPMLRLSEKGGAQVTLAADKGGVVALWSERAGRYGRIWAQRLQADGTGSLQPGADCAVDASPPRDEQLYPSAVLTDGRLAVAWEDRRLKHTIIMGAVERQGEPCRFSKPQRISEKPDGRNLPYGAGHGVSRVALGRFGEFGVFAAWADKRDFRDGYDIWGAFLSPDKGRFGSNVKIQDDFGGLAKQRHATVGGHVDGMLTVAWDDEREGHADVMLSWFEEGEWSEDWPLPPASGLGEQSNPTILLDDKGDLHVAWVERDEIGSLTRLRYALGRRQVD